MTDEAYIFISDSKDKKNISHSARYKKNGCKSKGCNLRTDRMTRKQWEKENGKIMTLKMNAPMSYKELKYYSKDQQYIYLQNLIDNYDASLKDIADMLGVGYTTISSGIQKRLGKKLVVPFGGAASHRDKSRWIRFIAGEFEDRKSLLEKETASNIADIYQKATPVVNEEAVIEEGEFSITGKSSDIVSILNKMIGNGTYKFKIHFEKAE